MTMLASLLDYLSAVPSPTPSIPPPLPQTSESSTPLWANLVVGLLGGLLGGTGVFAASWRSTKALRDNTKETLRHERTRLLNERFDTAAQLLGHSEAACRLAGVHAMAGLADDWPERRQTCIDVLCAYLRMPYPPHPEEDAPVTRHLAWQANREIRHTVIRTIRDHLLPTVPPDTSWIGYDLDFTSTVFDGGDFSDARFTGRVRFNNAEFADGIVSFQRVDFCGGTVSFTQAKFSGSIVSFADAGFSGGAVSFARAAFSRRTVSFTRTKFSGAKVSFFDAEWGGGIVSFTEAQFSGGTVDFTNTLFNSGALVFTKAEFSSGTVDFTDVVFSGATVDFRQASFTGGVVDIRDSGWLTPPLFDDDVRADRPSGLLLPDRPPESAS
ncbi:pentapeptide repeat-containing protein [Streptomyces sp. NBC_00882]|uniref:pentapeptide repeat-containing protein n=1 Tax=Streptomyces sp. NBC_00882 TaxID=2975856 RepID=UPI00386AB35C|nr:pentapeptide repeat-containing protein [Streptomyces sp. NBC_00882]